MKIKCEHCGVEWDTAGDIHGTETCRAYMKASIADLRAYNKRLEENLEWYRMEWIEEKRRAQECEEADARLREQIASLRKKLDDTAREMAGHLADAIKQTLIAADWAGAWKALAKRDRQVLKATIMERASLIGTIRDLNNKLATKS